MGNLFWTCVGWLTIPGLMHMAGNQKIEARLDLLAYVGLSLCAILIYGATAIHFGHPAFRNTTAEVISPLAAMVCAPNIMLVILSIIGIITGDWPSSADKNET